MTSVRRRWGWFAAALSIFFIVGVAPADWDQGEPFKMHYPQLPDPEGWDVCLVCQWIADDFTCTETGSIDDIHFWISWREDWLGEVPDDAWDVSIWSDGGGVPGVLLWQLGPGQGNIVTRWYGAGDQGWVCPSPPRFLQRPDHQEFYQVNITNIQNPWFQQEGTTYWLVIRANIPMWPESPVCGWKTSTNQPPGPIYQAPALWTTDLTMWQPVDTGTVAPELHDMAFVITGGHQEADKDYGDAPEEALAYSDGTVGRFPTCINVGPVTSYIEHGLGWGHFGDSAMGVAWDPETDGNGGLCPMFAPYDNDECFLDGDAGLMFPEPFTIQGGIEVPCPNSIGTPLGSVCQNAAWGTNVDIFVENNMPVDGWVNVLMDWDQDGKWGGSSNCAGTAAPEWVLVNWPVPAGYVGPLSASLPPGFLIGPNVGYVWTRFSITEQPITALDWDGSGIFEDGETEDYLLLVEGGPHELEPKWDQPPHGEFQGFDAASDYWWQEFGIKWEQLPFDGAVGYHAHDYVLGPDYIRLIYANDWRCPGGVVTDFHWWGSIEAVGSGAMGFHISIHKNRDPCMPLDPPDYQADIPISQITVTPTPYIDSLGRTIYRYDYDLPQSDWYFQEQGQLYWFDLCALSNDPLVPFTWVWSTTTPMLECPSVYQTEVNGQPGNWQQFDGDFAFRVTSIDFLGEEVNKVVADDFISDGRPIEQIYWAGSYLDPKYSPEYDPIEPFILDGWFISFHHADPVVNPQCPPDLVAGDPHPTVLAIYFAPVDAVTIVNRGYQDCFDHDVYDYSVDLSRCCLLCSHVDPRLPDAENPGQPDAFYETSGFGYWLDIQAVVGVTWDPPACNFDDRILTGHVPSDLTADRHFWGWHTSYVHNLEEACTGQIVDMTPYPPDCWDYGNWDKQPWLCPDPTEPVDMAFALMAQPCNPMGDVNWDGLLKTSDVECFVDCLLYGTMPGCVCTCADMDGNGVVDGDDIWWWVDAVIP